MLYFPLLQLLPQPVLIPAGLPQVFRRHPVIALNALCADLAERAGWKDGEWTWELGSTEEVSNKLHVIPLTLKR